jgi:RNA polymerase sigma factor (TIGR02999 family)
VEDVVRLMRSFRSGNLEAANDLVNLLYPDLRRLAASHMRDERAGHTWQPTALVNEFYLQLIKIKALEPRENAAEEKQAFLRLAAHMMKRLLIHHSRPLYRRLEKVSLTEEPESPRRESMSGPNSGDDELLQIDTALRRLENVNPRLRAVVELRVFSGLTGEEIAEKLGCGPATVARDWNFARRWLQKELRP